MTLWLVPVWAIPTTILALSLTVVLILLLYVKRHLTEKTGSLTPYTDQHGMELQDRIESVAIKTAAHRASLTRTVAQFDELSAETRAMRSALEAEAQSKERGEGSSAKYIHHPR